MVSNLDKEYTSINTIYEQQKEYRKTPEGKLAIKRANEKQLMKKMTTYNCGKCGECEFEVLNVYDDDDGNLCRGDKNTVSVWCQVKNGKLPLVKPQFPV